MPHARLQDRTMTESPETDIQQLVVDANRKHYARLSEGLLPAGVNHQLLNVGLGALGHRSILQST